MSRRGGGFSCFYLVKSFSPSWRFQPMLVKLEHFPKFRCENKKSLWHQRPGPRFHFDQPKKKVYGINDLLFIAVYGPFLDLMEANQQHRKMFISFFWNSPQNPWSSAENNISLQPTFPRATGGHDSIYQAQKLPHLKFHKKKQAFLMVCRVYAKKQHLSLDSSNVKHLLFFFWCCKFTFFELQQKNSTHQPIN